MEPHNTLHVVTQPVGHVMSVDCWCEPKDMEWSVIDGHRVLVVYHQDDSPHHHRAILAERDRAQDWITLLLNAVRIFPPRQLPPPKGPE